MSTLNQTIILNPPTSIHDEVFRLVNFVCPQCSGKGGFDYSGYLNKFKDNQSDSDWKGCNTCEGSGKLECVATLAWKAQKP